MLVALVHQVDSDDMFRDVKDLLWTNSTMARLLGSSDEIRSFVAQNYSLLYFGTYGCKNCDHLEAELISLAEERAEKYGSNPGHHHHLPIAVVNVHDHPELAREFRVHRVPTLRLYHEGLYRTIPQSEAHRGFIEEFVEQRIHLRKLPEIYSAERLDEAIKSVPHALVWVGDGAHKVDLAAKKLLRYLQFSLSHFHFYLIKNGTLAHNFNLKLHSLYEINSFDKQWKRIDVHSVLSANSTEVDISHLHGVKKKVLALAHPKVQMLDLIFLQKFGLGEVLVFYTNEKSGTLKDNKLLGIFNESCHSHLYLHTRCVIFCADASRDIESLTHLFHVPIASLTPNSIIFFHQHNHRRETYQLYPKPHESSPDTSLDTSKLLSAYHACLHHTHPQSFILAPPTLTPLAPDFKVDSFQTSASLSPQQVHSHREHVRRHTADLRLNQQHAHTTDTEHPRQTQTGSDAPERQEACMAHTVLDL